MNKDKMLNIILIVSIILIIHGLTKTGSSDKKEAQAGQNEVAVGGIGAIGSFVGKKLVVAELITAKVLWTGIIAMLVMWFPGFLKNLINVFKPQPTIPIWVWIVGFFILFMFVMQRKK